MAWYQGWGFWYESPDGSVNHATQISYTDPAGLAPPSAGAPGSPITTPSTTPPPTTSPPTGLTGDQKSAKAVLDQTLATFGLQSLGDKLWQEYLNDVPIDQIMLDMRSTPEYKTRFPAMAKLSSEGRAISEAQYVNYEQSAMQLWHSAGLNPDLITQGDFMTKWLEGDVSVAELQHRIQDLYVKVADTDPAVRQWYQQNFGTGAGDAALAASFADPETATPVLERQAAAAQFGGTGTVFGYNIGLDMATRAANAGITQTGAYQGFQQLQGLDPLFQETISEHQDLTAEQAGAESVFGLGKTGTQEIQRRQAEREAAFGGSAAAGGVQTQAGLGLGSAASNVGK